MNRPIQNDHVYYTHILDNIQVLLIGGSTGTMLEALKVVGDGHDGHFGEVSSAFLPLEFWMVSRIVVFVSTFELITAACFSCFKNQRFCFMHFIIFQFAICDERAIVALAQPNKTKSCSMTPL